MSSQIFLIFAMITFNGGGHSYSTPTFSRTMVATPSYEACVDLAAEHLKQIESIYRTRWNGSDHTWGNLSSLDDKFSRNYQSSFILEPKGLNNPFNVYIESQYKGENKIKEKIEYFQIICKEIKG